MAFVFYDTETTGTNWRFDQILQFAAIKTDADLKPLAEIHFESRLLPHVVPSPEAMQVNGRTPVQMTDPSLGSHYKMVRGIVSGLRGFGESMYMGFNSIDFDEKMLRAALYKTLHRPYLTVMDGNRRSDILRLARTADMLAPGALRVPLTEDGVPTFRLVELARANGYNHVSAHEARADIDATLHVARVLMNEAPGVWNDFMRFANRSTVLQHIQDEPIFGMAEFYKGKRYSWLVTRIGISSTDKNVHYTFDLQFDPDVLAAMDDETLVSFLGDMPRPIKRLKVNGCPVLFAVEDAPEGTEARLIDDTELERRVRRLRDDPHLRARLVTAREASLPVYPPSPHVEEQIFDTFTGDSDLVVLEQFHAAPWEHRQAILGSLQDVRLRVLGEELIYLERPDVLNGEQRIRYADRHRRRVLGVDGGEPWLTIPAAIALANKLIEESAPDARVHLEEHRDYLAYWRDWLDAAAA